MALLSWLRRWLRPGQEPLAAPLAGEIIDWNELEGVGSVQLLDSAVLTFFRDSCQGFLPLIGLHVEVLGVGMPAGDQPGALLATALRVPKEGEAAYSASLRVHELEREVRGGAAADRRRSVPGAQDPFFVFTLLLKTPLPEDPQRLADLLRSDSLPWLKVRFIPLLRRGVLEPGFSAEIKDRAGRRAFLLYRPHPFGADAAPFHAGLYVGGPHSPRAAAILGRGSDVPPLSERGEVRWLADLLRSLLRGEGTAQAVIVNRAGGARKPADTVLSQLGDRDVADHLPVLPWIDWNLQKIDGQMVQESCGMESLGLPDVAVLIAAGPEDDRAVARGRDALWFACQQLVAGALPAEATALEVPRGITLLSGSRLLFTDPADCDRYTVAARDGERLLLRPP